MQKSWSAWALFRRDPTAGCTYLVYDQIHAAQAAVSAWAGSAVAITLLGSPLVVQSVGKTGHPTLIISSQTAYIFCKKFFRGAVSLLWGLGYEAHRLITSPPRPPRSFEFRPTDCIRGLRRPHTFQLTTPMASNTFPESREKLFWPSSSALKQTLVHGRYNDRVHAGYGRDYLASHQDLSWSISHYSWASLAVLGKGMLPLSGQNPPNCVLDDTL